MRLLSPDAAERAASIAAFMAGRTVHHPALVCPLLIIWWDYLKYCKRWGFTPAKAYDFVPWLLAIDGIRVIEGGRGRFKRCIVGLGLKPTEREPT